MYSFLDVICIILELELDFHLSNTNILNPLIQTFIMQITEV